MNSKRVLFAIVAVAGLAATVALAALGALDLVADDELLVSGSDVFAVPATRGRAENSAPGCRWSGCETFSPPSVSPSLRRFSGIDDRVFDLVLGPLDEPLPVCEALALGVGPAVDDVHRVGSFSCVSRPC